MIALASGCRTLFSRCVLAGCMLLVAVSALAQANPPQVDPTHYWTYRLLDPILKPSPVFVQDQFFRAGVPLQVDSLDRLVNWVHKNNSAVRDTFLHYTWWNVQPKLPVNRRAIVTNQFGTATIQVTNVEFMLVPAWKNQPQPVFPFANHYLCYRAQGFPAPPLSYLLQDEWRQDVQHPDPMEYLCVPCLKEHQGQVFPPPDTLTHLALYPIHPQSDRFFPFIADQFALGQHLVEQQPVEYLLVPSLKVEIPTETKKTTWGRLKTLYR